MRCCAVEWRQCTVTWNMFRCVWNVCDMGFVFGCGLILCFAFFGRPLWVWRVWTCFRRACHLAEQFIRFDDDVSFFGGDCAVRLNSTTCNTTRATITNNVALPQRTGALNRDYRQKDNTDDDENDNHRHCALHRAIPDILTQISDEVRLSNHSESVDTMLDLQQKHNVPLNVNAECLSNVLMCVAQEEIHMPLNRWIFRYIMSFQDINSTSFDEWNL